MNTAEHIVESYFRLCRGCFTFADRKVTQGNNRQLDLLAFDVKAQLPFHIEVGVTHRENWCPTIEELGPQFEKKFFGAPPERTGKSDGTTDFEKDKSYFLKIESTYSEVGFSLANIKRVWVCWIVKEQRNNEPLLFSFESKHLNKTFMIEVLSLRDFILPKLLKEIGTANYDDEILRTLGFIKQLELQTAVA
jgi:hypothetical protein